MSDEFTAPGFRRSFLAGLTFVLWLLSPVLAQAASTLAQTQGPGRACPSLLDHRYVSLQGKPVNLCSFAGRPILVVNTASKCGYTPQFEKLEALHRRYQGRGLVVLGFPSNDFNQELATNQEIAEFCKLTYFVEFPMIEKGSVTGPGANPFYRQLAAASGAAPQWNFHKYLIAPDGKTVHSFATRVEPDSREIMGRLLPMLKQ